MKKYIFTIFVFFSFISTAYAGPFGTEMGDPVGKFRNLEFLEKQGHLSVYATKDIPDNPWFSLIRLFFYDGKLVAVNGVQKIGESRDIPVGSDKYFVWGSLYFGRIQEQLKLKYGQPTVEKETGQKWEGDFLPDNLKSIILNSREDGRDIIIETIYVYKNDTLPIFYSPEQIIQQEMKNGDQNIDNIRIIYDEREKDKEGKIDLKDLIIPDDMECEGWEVEVINKENEIIDIVITIKNCKYK